MTHPKPPYFLINNMTFYSRLKTAYWIIRGKSIEISYKRGQFLFYKLLK